MIHNVSLQHTGQENHMVNININQVIICRLYLAAHVLSFIERVPAL